MTLEGQAAAASEVRLHNIEALRRRFPDAVAVLSSIDFESNDKVRIQPTRNGSLTAVVEGQGRPIHVASAFDPVVEAERWVSGLPDDEGQLGVVVGCGMGYHLEALTRRYPNKKLVLVEPLPALFAKAIAHRDWRGVLESPNVELIVNDDARTVGQVLFARYHQELIEGASFWTWPAAQRYASGFVAELRGHILDLIRTFRTNIHTKALFSLQWIDNFFDNAGIFASDPGISSLAPILSGRPGIVVAAGPSLEKNGHLLRKAKGKALIIAAGSAVNPLLRLGVEPDLILSIDPGERNYDHFEHLKLPNVPLVYFPTIFPRIVQEYAGARFAVETDVFPLASWLCAYVGDRKGTVASGPSVANSAWHMAVSLGLNPVILVGQDLALTDLKTHATGAVHARSLQEDEVSQNEAYIPVQDIHGDVVYTTRPLNSMRLWFEQRLAATSKEQLTIDATEGGALIRGTVVRPLEEVLDEYCRDTFSPSETIRRVHAAETARLQEKDIEKRLAGAYEKLRKYARDTEKLAKRAISFGKQLESKCDARRITPEGYRQAVIRLEEFMKELVRLPGYSLMIEPVTGHIVTKLTLVLQTRWARQTNLQEKARSVAEQLLTLFTAVRDVSKRVREHLDNRRS